MHGQGLTGAQKYFSTNLAVLRTQVGLEVYLRVGHRQALAAQMSTISKHAHILCKEQENSDYFDHLSAGRRVNITVLGHMVLLSRLNRY